MTKNILCLLILITYSSFSQETQQTNVIGTWELIEMVNDKELNVDIGKLKLTNEQNEKTLDSTLIIRKNAESKDLRITKWHYIFQEDCFYEYRLEIGFKFDSKILNDKIHKSNRPYYKILSLESDTLKISELESKKTLILKKVKTDLSDLKVISPK
ncbi:hypothetical protein J8L88_21955 [Aquimarina sp. MMG015]|uniref:hypothetical protein n=1 Tax=Aquimarina sp. MMG015 TaxID=2822689 RepID=UPI001B39E5E6|nr:hypothetical protein [Aquimarina sp. MMG015]MBQ4805543.1 hypothetical protein [Aquimarina sp. MMG015]